MTFGIIASLDDDLGFAQRREDLAVEQFVSEFGIERG